MFTFLQNGLLEKREKKKIHKSDVLRYTEHTHAHMDCAV